RRRVLRRFFTAYLTAKQKFQTVWADDELLGAALWAPPGKWKTTPAEDLSLVPAMLQPRLLLRAPMVGWGMLGAERRHPPGPDHFYLAALGVSPAAQGKGLGSALIEPVLETCDRDGVPAYLEASKFENIAYYARHGFRQTGEIRLPRGPIVYPMWRDA
ncbi:MAG: GNAT family N-acetyltransferase, partial [Solirubrobacterales bacterium]